MIYTNNYETVSTFVEVMQKKTVASFFRGHGVYYIMCEHNALNTAPCTEQL